MSDEGGSGVTSHYTGIVHDNKRPGFDTQRRLKSKITFRNEFILLHLDFVKTFTPNTFTHFPHFALNGSPAPHRSVSQDQFIKFPFHLCHFR